MQGNFSYFKALATQAASSLKDLAVSSIQNINSRQRDYFALSTADHPELSDTKIREKLASSHDSEVSEGLRAILQVCLVIHKTIKLSYDGKEIS
jgi:hypothetical protein